MTAGELIKELSKYPPSTPVVLDGYEGGIDDVAHVHPMRIALNVHDDEHKTGIWGYHEDVVVEDGKETYYNRYPDRQHEIVDAIYLPRRDHRSVE